MRKLSTPLQIVAECAVALTFIAAGWGEAYIAIVATFVLGAWLHQHINV